MDILHPPRISVPQTILLCVDGYEEERLRKASGTSEVNQEQDDVSIKSTHRQVDDFQVAFRGIQ